MNIHLRPRRAHRFLTRSILAAIFLSAAAAHAADKPRDITTKEGVTYHHATIMGASATDVMLASDEGTVNIPITDLPPDMQKQLGYMTPEQRAKAEAARAAQEKAQAALDEQQKKAKLESSKHEILPGTEKDACPQLNPDFFPDELAPQISAYNTKAQYTTILSSGKHAPDTDATIKDNIAKLAALRTICENYKKFMANPPAGLDVAATRKAVAGQDYKFTVGEPEIVVEAIMGVPDKVETAIPYNNTTVDKVYHYGDSILFFIGGAYRGGPGHLLNPAM